MKIFITTKARQDLKNIAYYTQKEWGITQRNFYLDKVNEVFQVISKNPNKGKRCDYLTGNYFRYLVGSHVVFYRLSESGLQIIRILHKRMSFEKYFS